MIQKIVTSNRKAYPVSFSSFVRVSIKIFEISNLRKKKLKENSHISSVYDCKRKLENYGHHVFVMWKLSRGLNENIVATSSIVGYYLTVFRLSFFSQFFLNLDNQFLYINFVFSVNGLSLL